MNNPFYGADFRDYQVVAPNTEKLETIGAEILAIERPRTDDNSERAVMAVRFSKEFIGVQFHPEADVEGMRLHFGKDALRNRILTEHG